MPYRWCMKTTYAIVAALAAGVLLVGCSSKGTTPGASGSPTPSSTATVSTTPAVDSTLPAVTPSPARSEDQVVIPPSASTARNTQAPAQGSRLVLTAIRTATHTGVDRVVLEFSGTGAPGWTVEYVDKAIGQGSGQQVAVKGTSILQVQATGTTYPQAGSAVAVPQRTPGDGKGLVAEVVNGGTFEGTTQAFIGLDTTKKPFAVQVLQSPTRLVVDIVH